MPKDMILSEVATVPGIDGQKMSKSYKNTIPLFATDEEIRTAVMKIPTDSLGISDSKDPDKSIIYQIHSLVLDEQKKNDLRKKFVEGGVGYKDLKEQLIQDLIGFIKPLREKREELSKDIDRVMDVLKDGKIKIRKIVEQKMDEVRQKVGVKLY